METERVDGLINLLRSQCLHKGHGGIKQLGVVFRRLDKDFSRKICFQELEQGIKDYGLDISDEDLSLLFNAFDKDKNNYIDFKELVARLRPPMTKSRIDVVNQAFNRLDVNSDDVLAIEDLKIVYSTNARKHPKYVSGEWTEEQTLRNFLDSIDTPGCPDGKVTREEFMNYYSGVSATVEDDSYFDLMMRACYGLPNKGEAPTH